LLPIVLFFLHDIHNQMHQHPIVQLIHNHQLIQLVDAIDLNFQLLIVKIHHFHFATKLVKIENKYYNILLKLNEIH
jgi:hypothetical protein